MIMKNKSWITGLLLVILTSIAIGVRIYYVNYLMSDVDISEDIYNAAKVTVGTTKFSSFFINGLNIKSVYICSLYITFLIFGNFTVAGVYLNLLYQVLTVLLVFASVKNISNRYIGFGVGIIAAIVPLYVERMSKVTVFNMQLFLVAIGCSLLTFVLKILYQRYHKNKLVHKNCEVTDFTNAERVQDTATKPEMQSVQDHSMREIKLDDLEEKKFKFIENPLPVPKRREHKEMDFVIELTEDTDDYDLKDISGKDFFDIE